MRDKTILTQVGMVEALDLRRTVVVLDSNGAGPALDTTVLGSACRVMRSKSSRERSGER